MAEILQEDFTLVYTARQSPAPPPPQAPAALLPSWDLGCSRGKGNLQGPVTDLSQAEAESDNALAFDFYLLCAKATTACSDLVLSSTVGLGWT